MSKFNLTKRISLAEVLGEGHERDYLRFKPLTFKDAKGLETLQPEEVVAEIPKDATAAQIKKLNAEATAKNKAAAMEAVDKAVAFMQDEFVSGEITDEETNNLVAVTKEDFTNDNLSMDVINYCMKALAGRKPEGFTTA